MQTKVSEREVARRRNASSGPRRRGVVPRLAVFCASVFFLLIVIGNSSRVFAVDELYLTGIVKNIVPASGLVYVDVLSANCHGMRTFKADDPENLENFIGKRISFFIDSNKCEVREVHTIVTSRGVWK